MSRLINMTGQTFGRLTVIERHDSIARNGLHAKWICKCICGKSNRTVRRICKHKL